MSPNLIWLIGRRKDIETEGDAGETQEKRATYKPRREASGDIKPANHLNFQPPELLENKFGDLSHTVCDTMSQQS